MDSEKQTDKAFATLKPDGSVIASGDAQYGGDCGHVQEQLKSGVKSIYSNKFAFAALKDDGSVVAWGHAGCGGDCSDCQEQLNKDVKCIYSNERCFAALKADGSVVTWGNRAQGGDSSAVQEKLSSGVLDIYPVAGSFAAVKADGSVVPWGCDERRRREGLDPEVQEQLSTGVWSVHLADAGFAFSKDDGTVVAWGVRVPPAVEKALASQKNDGKVLSTICNENAIAALKSDGSVAVWGNEATGGAMWTRDDIRTGKWLFNRSECGAVLKEQLASDVQSVYATQEGFAALKVDGSVVGWGTDSSDAENLANAVKSGTATLKDDGSAVTWGTRYGKECMVAWGIAPLDSEK